MGRELMMWPVTPFEFGGHERWETSLGLVTVRRNLRRGWWDAHPVEDVQLLRQLAHKYPRGDSPQAAVDALLARAATSQSEPE